LKNIYIYLTLEVMTSHKAQIYISRSILLTMKHWPIAITVCVSLLAFNLFYFVDFAQADFGGSGWAGSEILNPDETLFCDFETSKPSGDPHQFISGDPGAIYPAGQATTYWETNDSYCYWGNATSAIDTDSGWGIGRGIFTLDDPVGTSEYWVVNVTYWTVGIVFLSPTWTQIGSYSLSTSGLWCAGNLGVGITASATSDYLIHSQMHPDAGSGQDGWWWINGETPTDAPPDQWMRPEGGTFAYPFLTNTLYNRPFTLEEVRNMAIIIELSFLPTIFGNFDFCGVGGVSIAIGGLSVEAIPTTYTPPDYSSGFILRPESDYAGDNWKTKDYATTNLYAQIDENNTGSDQDTSWIYANWTSVNTETTYAQFKMTDTPEYAEETTYTAYLWAIMKSDYQDYNALAITGFTFENATLGMWYIGSVGVSENWANYSMTYSPVVKSGEIAGTPIPGPFTLSQLDNIVSSVYLFPYQNSSDDYGAYLGKLKISQLAIFCVPASLPDSDALIAEINMNSLIWLIILYLPALAIAQFVPKLGFVAGMSLMLGVFGLAQAGFFQISVMGFVAMMVALYKDS